MNLDINNWKEYRIDKLFYHFATGKANQTILTEGNDSFYVGATRNNNGVMVHCEHDESLTLKGNCIVFICNGEGSVGYANYMDRDFIASTDLVAGYMDNLNYLRGCFLATVLSQERPKYSFGRKWKTHLKNTIIKLPSITNEDGTYEPDWEYMEDYIKSLHHKPLTTKNNIIDVPNLNISDWKSFKLSDYFNPIRGIRLVESDRENGNIPLVTAGEFDNGVKQKISNDTITRKNCITIDMFGNSFYQNNIFSFDDNIIALEDKLPLSKYTKLFLVSILRIDKYRYQYGRQYRLKNFNNQMIKLPATLNAHTNEYEPDWEYMENYIKSLPYGDRI